MENEASPNSSRRSLVIKSILNQLPISPDQLNRLKEELRPASQNLDENIKFIQCQMKSRGINENIEPLKLKNLPLEVQIVDNYKEKSIRRSEKNSDLNSKRELEVRSHSFRTSGSNRVKKSPSFTKSAKNTPKTNLDGLEIPPLNVYSDQEEKQFSCTSSEENLSDYNKENTCNTGSKDHRNFQNSSTPPTMRSFYQNEKTTSKKKGKFVLRCENCMQKSIPEYEPANGDNLVNQIRSNSNESPIYDEEWSPQNTDFEFYEISSNEQENQREIATKKGCCFNLNQYLRTIFSRK